MRAIAYLRKSNRESTDKRYEEKAVEQQRTAAVPRAAELAWQLDARDVYADDAVSGGIMHRPGLLAAMAAVASGKFGGLLTWEWERVGRTDQVYPLMALAGEMVEHGCYMLHLIGENRTLDLRTDAAQMEIFMKSYGAGQQRKSASMAQRRAKQQKAERGELPGRKLYGYSKQREIVDPKARVMRIAHVKREADVIRQIFRRRADDEWGYYLIRDELNAAGEPAPQTAYKKKIVHFKNRRPSSGKWSTGTVGGYLKNETYVGTLRWTPRGGEPVVWTIENPIVDRKLWDRAQAVTARMREASWRTDGGRRLAGRPPTAKYMLSGLVKCGGCGGGLSVTEYKWTSKPGETTYRLKCVDKTMGKQKKCPTKPIPMELAETAVLREMRRALRAEAMVRWLEQRLDGLRRGKADLAAIDREIAKLGGEQRKAAAFAVASGNHAAAVEQLRAIDGQIQQLQDQRLAAGGKEAKKLTVKQAGAALEKTAKQWLAQLDKNAQTARGVLAKLLNGQKIVIGSLGPDFWQFRSTADLSRVLGDAGLDHLTNLLRQAAPGAEKTIRLGNPGVGGPFDATWGQVKAKDCEIVGEPRKAPQATKTSSLSRS